MYDLVIGFSIHRVLNIIIFFWGEESPPEIYLFLKIIIFVGPLPGTSWFQKKKRKNKFKTCHVFFSIFLSFPDFSVNFFDVENMEKKHTELTTSSLPKGPGNFEARGPWPVKITRAVGDVGVEDFDMEIWWKNMWKMIEKYGNDRKMTES